VQRVIDHDYIVMIYYVYQDPIIAWNYTKIREQAEGRLVPVETFINAYYAARKNVIQAKERFGQQVKVNIFIKDFNNNIAEYLSDVDNLTLVVPPLYERVKLEEDLK